MDDLQMNTNSIIAMMNGSLISPPLNNNKKSWGYGSVAQRDSLLGMTSALFSGESFARSVPPPPMNMAGLFPFYGNDQGSPPSPVAITARVLAELEDESMFEPPSEDIFDMEPVPLHPNHSASQRHNSRISVLEDTLNKVLSIEDMFAEETPQVSEPYLSQAVAPISSDFAIKRSADDHPMMMSASPSNKRQRTMEETEEETARRFRPYQAEQWSEKFDELIAFKNQRGHCCVPHTFDENPSLARWVKRQRYQYKLKAENKPSTMTDERIVALEQNGFVWDSHGAAWMERWNELREFQRFHRHANVPSNYSKSPQLATWVKCQRRQYKLFCNRQSTNMTLDRLQRLQSVGFEWELRSGSTSKNNKAKSPDAASSIHNLTPASFHF